jgi:hypothetical protein
MTGEDCYAVSNDGADLRRQNPDLAYGPIIPKLATSLRPSMPRALSDPRPSSASGYQSRNHLANPRKSIYFDRNVIIEPPRLTFLKVSIL